MREQILAMTPSDDVLLSWPAYVEHLLVVGRTDVALGKLVEGHLDALRIHHEAGTQGVPGATYGVWASRSRGTGLSARQAGGAWVLDGTLAFASGGGVVDRALIPAWTSEEHQQLLDVDVSAWEFDTSRWRTRAMATSRTGSTTLADVEVDARTVGEVDFYLRRQGFFPGGVGVAAVWAGGAARVADLVEAAVPAERRSSAQQVRVGRMRTDVALAAAVCRDYARSEPTTADDTRLPATLARAAVAAAGRRVLDDARAVAGAVGLALDEAMIRSIDDLTLYLAQQDADKDAAWLGEP